MLSPCPDSLQSLGSEMDVQETSKLECLKKCLLTKLAKNFDETDYHPEYKIHQDAVQSNFFSVIQFIEQLNIEADSKLLCNSLSTLLILYKELQSDGPWNDTRCKEFSKKLNIHFDLLHGTTLDNLLKSKLINAQNVFDFFLESQSDKFTVDDFKKYPTLIYVYCSFINDAKDCNLVVKPQKAMAFSLILIQDYERSNQIKGLQCCQSILQCLSLKDFQNCNYYEIIYETLLKRCYEKDLMITNINLECLVLLLRLLPKDIKETKTDLLLSNILDQIMVESNFYRKRDLVKFVKDIIKINEVYCMKRKKKFIETMLICLDCCSMDSVWQILLMDVIECLEEWFKYNGVLWKLSLDFELLSELFKVFVIQNNKHIQEKINNLILTIIKLCKEEEQLMVKDQYDKIINRSLEYQRMTQTGVQGAVNG